MADRNKGIVKSTKGKDTYLLQAYLIEVGADRNKKRGCGSWSDATRLIK